MTTKGDDMKRYFVILEDGKAVVQARDFDDQPDRHTLGDYATEAEAEQRRDIENDPQKRALFLAGKLKISN